MSSIKVVDVDNEEAKEEEPTEQIEEVKEVKEEQPEEPPATENEVFEQVKEQPKEEPKEELKNNPKTERYKDKMITCPKCSKTMLLRSYRYTHENNCQGNIENKPIKPQAKPKPKPQQKPQPEPAYYESSEEEHPQQKPIKKKQPVQQQQPNPSMDITRHFQFLQQQFRQQKQERYNNLCQSMFASRSGKRSFYFSNLFI